MAGDFTDLCVGSAKNKPAISCGDGSHTVRWGQPGIPIKGLQRQLVGLGAGPKGDHCGSQQGPLSGECCQFGSGRANVDSYIVRFHAAASPPV